MIHSDIQAIILAAGKSTRFNTGYSKQLAQICGQSMILYPLKMLNSLGIHTTVVVGFQSDAIKEEVERAGLNNINFVIQEQQAGSGDAVACSRASWSKDNILIINADMPLVSADIILDLYELHKQRNALLSICTTKVMEPTGYGRIVRESKKIRIVEEKDCSGAEKQINEINSGIYLVNKEFLLNVINQLPKSAISNEIYFTKIAEMVDNVEVLAVAYDSVRGVNTLEELWAVEQIKRSDLIKYWMSRGVRFDLAQNVHIDINVEIGQGSKIGGGSYLLGNTKIGKNVIIGPYVVIENSLIQDNSMILSHSVITDSSIGSCAKVGPFAHLRPDTILSQETIVGSFVEIKNSSLGSKSKAKHLAFLGDATIGKKVNIGAGTIIANYNGISKNHTIIEDNVFIGSNSVLIAPIKVGSGAFVAAGSTINKDVSENDLAIARARQENKKDYALLVKEKAKKQKEEASKMFPSKELKSGVVENCYD